LNYGWTGYLTNSSRVLGERRNERHGHRSRFLFGIPALLEERNLQIETLDCHQALAERHVVLTVYVFLNTTQLLLVGMTADSQLESLDEHSSLTQCVSVLITKPRIKLASMNLCLVV
jgi:hypothetical protein